MQGGPQALTDLLEHFDLAQKIRNTCCPIDMTSYFGNKYFMPCMLKVSPDERSQTAPLQKPFQQAAILHIFFNTGYVPPGFFVRLIAQMTSQEAYIPLFKNIVYRDNITFKYKEIDELSILLSLYRVSESIFNAS